MGLPSTYNEDLLKQAKAVVAATRAYAISREELRRMDLIEQAAEKTLKDAKEELQKCVGSNVSIRAFNVDEFIVIVRNELPMEVVEATK